MVQPQHTSTSSLAPFHTSLPQPHTAPHSPGSLLLLQTWCRGRKKWQSELLCLDCLHFSYRAYSDPDFMSPEEHQKQYWTSMAVAHDN